MPPARPFSLLVKPASADCNLRCRYCFYLDHCDFYPDTSRHRMTEETLERMVSTYMRTPQPQYSFGWQGGEPTLMGLDFFRKAVEFQQRYGSAGASVGNGLQTNGTLITDDMARFFGQYHFLAGVSLDGPEDIHDKYRLTADDRGSHADVLRGLKRLRTHGVEFNILTLVSESNVKQPRRVYDYLCDRDYLFHQYIPCVEAGPDGRVLPFSISGEQWGEFMCTLFDLWHDGGDTRRISIRLFDSILTLLVDGNRNLCHFGANCCQYFVVEYNGDIYPCDFFVEKPLHLGNIHETPWADLQRSPTYRQFGALKRKWHPECGDCEFGWICRGDCLKNRLWTTGGDPRAMSHLCEGWKMFFAHTLPRFRALAKEIVAERKVGGGQGRSPRPCVGGE